MVKKKYLALLLVLLIAFMPITASAVAPTNFQTLVKDKIINTDYKIESCKTNSNVAVIAIHGGGIEPGTNRIAALIAGGEPTPDGSYKINKKNAIFNYYSFVGLLKNKDTEHNNFEQLFLKATQFDEATGSAIVQDSEVTLSIIGIDNENDKYFTNKKVIYVGGLDTDRKDAMVAALKTLETTCGITVIAAPDEIVDKSNLEDINGNSPENICNKNKLDKGLQLALSMDLRMELVDPKNSTELNAFVKTIQDVLKAVNTSGGSGGGGGGGGTATTITTEPAVILFTDISGHWAEQNIIKAVGTGFIQGYPDKTFKPNQQITRAEFIVAFIKALKIESAPGKVFADTQNHWAKDYISTAAAKGIINSSVEEFNPDSYIQRQEIAKIIANTKNITEYLDGIDFSDKDQFPKWSLDAINWVSDNNIMVGYPDSTFRPTSLATRAEATTVLLKLVP